MRFGGIAALRGALARFTGRRIVVVGDIMLDRYVYGNVMRISPEAPVPVLLVEDEIGYAGGAANVAVNLARLGAYVALVGVVGPDRQGQELIELLANQDIDVSGVIVDPARRTTIKQRLIARGHQLARCDWESNDRLSGSVHEKVLHHLGNLFESAEAIICSDYAKGLAEHDVIEAVAGFGSKAGIPTLVDPKAPTFDRYDGIQYITPNEAEFHKAFGVGITGDEVLLRGVCSSLGPRGWKAVLVTRGEVGVSILEPDRVAHIPGHRAEVFDIVGAGDTFIAALALGLAGGLSVSEAATIANVASSIVVTKAGTAYVQGHEIDQKLLQLEQAEVDNRLASPG